MSCTTTGVAPPPRRRDPAPRCITLATRPGPTPPALPRHEPRTIWVAAGRFLPNSIPHLRIASGPRARKPGVRPRAECPAEILGACAVDPTRPPWYTAAREAAPT